MADKSDETKKNVIKELLLSEEESATELKPVIERTKTLVRIDAKKVVLASQFDYTIPEGIVLLLIGNHFTKELGKQSGIVETTLSGKLGLLMSSGYIGQDEQKRYHVQRHKTREIVDVLHSKYVAGG